MTEGAATGSGVVRGTALSLLAVTIGAGLLVQLGRSHSWTDPTGSVLYVMAAALLIMVVRPGWPPWLLAALASAAAIAVELCQVPGGPVSWLPRSGLLRLLFGSTFTIADVCWLVAGAGVAWLAARLVALAGAGGQRRPDWHSGLALAAGGVATMLFGGWLGWAVEAGGRRLPGLAEWVPIVLGAAVLLAGMVDLWRGLSRDDRTPDPQSLGRRMAVVLLLAVPAVMMVAFVVGTAGDGGPLLVAVVAAGWFGLAILMSVVAGWGDGVPQRGRALVGSCAALAVVILGSGVAGSMRPGHVDSDPPPPQPVATRSVVTTAPTVAAPPPPRRFAPAPDASAGVPLCRVDQLTALTQGWDATMGDTAVTVAVTNTGSRDCAVQGLPTISLLQGRAPLQLTIDHESINRPGQVDGPRRALVRASGEVRVLLLWAGYRTQADGQTPQALTLHAPGVGSLPVELDQGPAPFDLMDGGQVSVSGWR